MDSGQPCNCGHCMSCDPEGYSRKDYEALVKKQYQVANDDKLFEKEKQLYENFVHSDLLKKEYESGYISNIGKHFGDVYMGALIIRSEQEFFKKHSRHKTMAEVFNLVNND